jgi:signal transduction histidine kinase/ligand-binding sensor domain-containing protein
MLMKVGRRIIAPFLFLLPVLACAQQFGFRNFSLEEGLPQTEVQALMQDSRGMIWVGTNGGGLSSFNGNSFSTFTTRDGMPDNIVYSLCEGRDGNIWMGSVNAIVRYDGMAFTTFRETDHPRIRIYPQIYADNLGRIWAVSQDEQNFRRMLIVSDGQVLPVSEKFPELTMNNLILNVFYSNHGIHYITTNLGLYELNDEQVLRPSPLNDNDALAGMRIIPLFQDREGYIWIASIVPDTGIFHFYRYRNGVISSFEVPGDPWWNGVVRVHHDAQQRTWFVNFGNGVAMHDPADGGFHYFRQKNGLQSDFIQCILEDHEGNVWLGSRGNGLIKYSKNSFVSFDFDQIIHDNVVRRFYQDRQGDMWFGLAGTGIVQYNGNTFIPYDKEAFPGINNVRGFAEIGPDLMLLASINGLYHFDKKNIREVSELYGLDPGQYSDLLLDGDTIWLSTINNGLSRIVNGRSSTFNRQSGHLQSNILNSIFRDSQGNIWVCANNGVGKYSHGRFSWYDVGDGLNYPIVLQMTEDDLGRYWFASYLGGINIFDGEEFTYLTMQDGLSSDNIYSITKDRDGNIWAGTGKGIDLIHVDTAGHIAGIQGFGIYDGFTGIENNGTAIFIDRDDNLWFGTVKGAMRYDPKKTQPNTHKPQTYITGVKLFFREIDWEGNDYADFRTDVTPWFILPEGLVFPHDSNHLSFVFESLSYQVPEKVRYQWKLEGLDKEWSPVSSNTEAVYANIPPGEYTFMVKAMNNDGFWNETPTTFSFRIKPPWWGTWYFYLVLAILILTGITLTVRFRIKRIEAKKQELEQIVLEKTTEVRNQNRLLEKQKQEMMIQAENLQASYTNLENLSEIGKTITSQLTVEKIIDTVYASINKLMDASVFGIGILNKKTNTIDFPGVKEKGETLDFLSFDLLDELRLSSYCVRTREEIFINDFDSEFSRYLPAITPPDPKTGNSSSIIYLPMILNDEVMGVITVQSFQKNAYNEYHLNIVRNLAVYSKIALDNAAAYKQIEQQSDHLRKANRDIRKQKQQIEQTNRELVDLNKEKNYLIEIVAHDLRNPLTSSLAIANNLSSGEVNLKQENRESLDFLVNALNRMRDLIVKILDIRMIEQKKINMNRERTDLSQVVDNVCRNMQAFARHKNINIKLENPETYGFVDKNYLSQIFENLLSNAIKFSPRDKDVLIMIREVDGEIRVHFKDEGPGIEKDEMKRLFGKYQKLSARPTGGEHSTGLGLSIVKKYVDLMGGRVWCESEPGKGSNFIVAFRKGEWETPTIRR